ncbi:S41 family peptidase [uncultured Sphingomonas sp.]|uniref:S41 family peptidase n=1 Tax=uncultured Sphingomonas sp. TaxID=158754 RepID=UPI0025E25FB5|nr:S41 family peptidase [uncultured Sphingomonas sp.]
MKSRRIGAAASILAMLGACGGGGTGTGSVSGPFTSSPAPSPTPTPTASPTPTATAGCSLRERQTWVAAQLREWYLFYETLPTSLDPAAYSSVDAYVDALTATARSQRRDRYFTYVTSIAEENAYYASGETAGFGFRLSNNATTRRTFVAEAFEGAPALNAGVDRGTEIVAIGTTSANLRAVSDIIASEGTGGVTNALGPNTPGTTRVFRIRNQAGTTSEVSIAKADYALTPVSSRYGYKILDDNGKKVGYINLRTFISTANDGLRTAFAALKAAGVSEVVIDLRYNGGGLVSVAETFGRLLGANRSTSDVFSYTNFRPEKSSQNGVAYFAPQTQSIAPTKIAFIGMSGTASASELLINAFIPYLGTNMALIGSNTYGKPVGQIALDKPECDDRLRVVAFATQNKDRSAAYFDGLATVVPRTCQATDDFTYPLGDAREGSIAAALNFLGGRSCTPITATAQASAVARSRPVGSFELLTPDRPNTAQREVPGAF